MKGFITLLALFLVALAVSSQEYGETGEVEHGHRSKRSPYDPLVAPLILGKSFLLGAVLGPKIFHKGWGPRHHHHHGGWGWSPPSRGWGWSSPVVHVSHGWGW